MSEWKSIETAPKDGKDVILLTDGRSVGPGWWTSNHIYPWAFIDNTRWVREDDQCCEDMAEDLIAPNGYTEKDITHWMPLPEPPK